LTKPVDLHLMKEKAMGWPEPVKTLVLSEPDSIPFMDFIIKLGEWEKLLNIQKGR